MEDFNYLVDLKDQMGLFTQDAVLDYMPNATKCWKWEDVKASHKNDATLVITVEKLFGTFILLGMGLGGAMVALIMECLTKETTRRFKKTSQISKQAWVK